MCVCETGGGRVCVRVRRVHVCVRERRGQSVCACEAGAELCPSCLVHLWCVCVCVCVCVCLCVCVHAKRTAMLARWRETKKGRGIERGGLGERIERGGVGGAPTDTYDTQLEEREVGVGGKGVVEDLYNGSHGHCR